MANIQNIPLNEELRYSNPKINQNFQSLNNELTGHINSTSAHKSEDITYSGEVPGSNVKQAIDSLDIRIDDIVAQSGDDITEIVDARGGYPVLGARLDDMIYKGDLFISIKDFASGDTFESAHIQAAMDYVEQIGGGIVYAPSGEYLINTIVRMPSNITFLSSPNALYKRVSNIDVMFINKTSGTGGYFGAENIKISGGTFDANYQSYPEPATTIAFGHATNVVIENALLLNTTRYHAIELNGVDGGLVQDCTFIRQDPAGTELVQIDLFASDATGVFPWFGPYDNTPCRNITIEECRFFDGVDGVGSHTFVMGYYHQNITIQNNYFKNLSGSAIKTLNYIDLLVDNNHIEDVFRGVFISAGVGDSTKNTRITRNNIYRSNKTNLGRAIQVGDRNHKGIIEDNYVETVGRHGIGVDRSTDWQVTNNRVYDAANNGIWIYGSSNVVVSGNTVKRSVTTDYDIIAGATGEVNNKNIFIGNICDRLGAFQCTDGVFTNNVIAVSMGFSGNTNTFRANNMINGVWTP